MISRVYIEYDLKDQDFTKNLTSILNANDIHTEYAPYTNLGDSNYRNHAEGILEKNDFIIWILSKNTLNYDFLLWYSSAISEIELSEENRKLMLPIFIDMDMPVFDFLLDRVRFLISYESPKGKYDDIMHTIHQNAGQRFFNKSFRKKCKSEAVRKLSQAYTDNNLILFCGAGISAGSGVPTWNDLVIRCFIKSSNMTSLYTNLLYDMLSKDLYLNQSILARMIKNSSKDIDFHRLVQQTLYESIESNETETIKAIVDLCEPSMSGGVNSIITYNFDDLLECNLKKRNIKYQSRIAGNYIAKKHLSIEHVHGFLPRSFDEKETYHVVFSEDEYHKQYSDNLACETRIQLDALESGCCLYVGISFTDPNMRRLADIYIGKHPDCIVNPRHYLIKQKPQNNPDWKHNFLSQKKVLEQIMFLEELDAESFGFRIIWIDDFNEISQLFSEIKNGNKR